MAIDTPARIAILGAGPIGLEAALYARYLGYEVCVLEAGQVAHNLLRWGHVRLFTPFGQTRSSLGVAAIRSQRDDWQPPPDDALLTGRELRERYYIPLAETDLLADSIHCHHRVLAIGRSHLQKADLAGDEARCDFDFRLLVRNEQTGVETLEAADVVLDCTGTYDQPNPMGHGGVPAVGESAVRGEIAYHLTDVCGECRSQYAGRHTVVVGADYTAAMAVIALADLAQTYPGTRFTWITHAELGSTDPGPVAEIADDPFAERSRVVQSANHLARAGQGSVTHWPGTMIEVVRKNEAGWELELVGQHAGTIVADEILSLTGYRPEKGLFAELQVAVDPCTDAPLPPPGPNHADTHHIAEDLFTGEPDFYVLGAKRRGRDRRFAIVDGLDEIRRLFALLYDRPDLDLYARMKAR